MFKPEGGDYLSATGMYKGRFSCQGTICKYADYPGAFIRDNIYVDDTGGILPIWPYPGDESLTQKLNDSDAAYCLQTVYGEQIDTVSGTLIFTTAGKDYPVKVENIKVILVDDADPCTYFESSGR